jgi:subtilisin family serine protease
MIYPSEPAAPPPEQARSPDSGCLNAVLFAIACVWVVGATIAAQLFAWGYDQYMFVRYGMPQPGWFWLLVALGQGLLLALPVVPLAVFTRAPRFRAAYWAWTLAIGFGVLLSLARLNPMTSTQPAAVVQIVLSLLATFALARFGRGEAGNTAQPARRSPLAWGLALGIVIALPWLYYGALGSPLDTLLNLLASACLGLFAGLLLDRFLLAPLARHSSGALVDVGFGGVAAGVALLVLGAGFGFGGSQVPLMIAMLPLGGTAAALGLIGRARSGRGWPAVAMLVGAVAAGPLLLLDPDEFSLALSDEIGWVFGAAFLSLLIAAVVGLALWLLVPRLIELTQRRGLALGGLVAACALAALLYVAGGRPGFYGEKIFVILRDQADVSQARGIADRNERLRFVYTTLTQHADQTQAGIRATLDQLGIAYRPYYLVNAIEVDAGPLVRAYLASRPEVDRIIESPRLRPLAAQPQPERGDRLPIAPPDIDAPPVPSDAEWNIAAIGADRVWGELGVTGAGIVLGESDSGVEGDHPALRGGYRGQGGHDDYNWLDPWNGSPSPVDVGGHGTHTTGTAVGRGGIGVAPGAQWIGCVNLARNLGNPPHYLDCMQFMLAPYPRGGDPFKDGDAARAAHVLNNSWGCPPIEGCDPASLAPAVRALRAAGIFVVASAGNEGPLCGSVSDPIAIYADSFSVGAIDQAGDVADFSSRGPVTVDGSTRVKPDILAPGVAIRSSLPGGTYGQNDGTSMAGPHVAGVVALMWSAQPKLIGDIDRTEQILRDTARDYVGQEGSCGNPNAVPNDTAGYGVVDAYAAVKAAQAVQ